jgi:methionyl-tRNA formyltransferase
VTTFKLKHEIDTGDILLRERIPIGPDETAGEVHDRMKEIGAQLLVRTVEGLIRGDLKETPQEGLASELKHAPKLFTEDSRIDWNRTAKQIHDQVRGLSPFPGAFTSLDDKTLKVYRTRYENGVPTSAIGVHETDGKKWLRYQAADGFVYILDLQLEGKKRMLVEDFLRGYRFC